jgi:exosortase
MNVPVPTHAGLRRVSLALLLTVLVPFGCLLWAFWTTLADLTQVWQSNAQYSHGWLVPAFALFLLWARRDRLQGAILRPSWWGLPILALALGLRLAGVYYYFISLDPIALIPCVAALCLLIGGWAAWRWAWPAILFLGFMVPLPDRVASSLSEPLQALATVSSTFVMQVLGLPALAEGNVILLNDHQIGIVEACNGLRMLMVFFALAVGVALVARRPLLDRLVLVVSAVPIALASNIVRITVTGILYDKVNSETAHVFFHDVAGYLMMPLALVMLGIELKLLSCLFLEVPADTRVPRIPAVRRRPPSQKSAPVRTPRKRQRPPVVIEPAPETT